LKSGPLHASILFRNLNYCPSLIVSSYSVDVLSDLIGAGGLFLGLYYCKLFLFSSIGKSLNDNFILSISLRSSFGGLAFARYPE